MTHTEPYAIESPFLRVEIVCLVPGPQLTPDERTALTKLYKHVEAVGELLFAGHDPDGYEEMLDLRDEQDGPNRSWNDLITNPAPAKVTPIRPDVDVQDPVVFGRGLRALRHTRNLSRMQLKVLAGLGNHMYLAEIEAGNKYPNEATIEKLAGAFEMTSQALVAVCSRVPVDG